MKKILLLMVTSIAIISLAACNSNSDYEGKPRVKTTLFAQYDMARALAGDHIDLEFVVPAGVSPHNFEPGPRQLIDILESDLLLYSGDLMEPWVSRLIDSGSNVNLVDLSENILLIDESQRRDDNGFQEGIETFEILNRNDDNSVISYLHNNHWHGELPSLDEGDTLSLGAYIETDDGEHLELDSDGSANGLSVSLHEGAEDDIVELSNHGDHVHITALNEGVTQVVFNWTQDDEVRYSTPPLYVVVGDADVPQEDYQVFDEMNVFEILNRQNEGQKTAYVHGDHWHGNLPSVGVEDYISLGANIESPDGQQRALNSDGFPYGLTVDLAEGAQEGIVEFKDHGDHVHITGLSEGITQVVFKWTHDGNTRFTTPPINVSVSEDSDDEGQGVLDPHFWLDPLNAEQMVIDVRDALIDLLPEHEDEITQNAEDYIASLNELHEEMLHVRENVEFSVVMHGGHNAFNYFMSRYDIEYITPYRGYSTDAEPTSGAIREMIDRMDEYGINYLFSEKLISESVANTISEQTGAEILYIYDGENAPVDEFNEGITFLDMMRHNIEQYKIGLNYSE